MVQHGRESENWNLIKTTFNNDAKRLSMFLSKKCQIGGLQLYRLFNLAAACGNTASMNVLMNAMPKFDINRKDETGCSALYYTTLGGHTEAIVFLLLHGAKPNVHEFLNGNTPLHEAAVKGFSRSVEAFCLSQASTNLLNKSRFTPLHLAAQNGHKQTTRILLYFGADVNAKNKYGDTPLHTATRYGHTGVVRILLTVKASLTATNANYDTPLHIAAARKRNTIVRLLVEAQSAPTAAAAADADSGICAGLGSRILSCGLGSSPAPASTVRGSTVAWPRQFPVLMRNLQNETPVEIARRKGNGKIARLLKVCAQETLAMRTQVAYPEEVTTDTAKEQLTAAQHPMYASMCYPSVTERKPPRLGSSWHCSHQQTSKSLREATPRAAVSNCSSLVPPTDLGGDLHHSRPNASLLASETGLARACTKNAVSQAGECVFARIPSSAQQLTVKSHRCSTPSLNAEIYQTMQPWRVHTGEPPELGTSQQLPDRHRFFSDSLKQHQHFPQKPVGYDQYQHTSDMRGDVVMVSAGAAPVRDLRSPFSELRQSLEAAFLSSRTKKGGSPSSSSPPDQAHPSGQPHLEAVHSSGVPNDTSSEAASLRKEVRPASGVHTTTPGKDAPTLRSIPPQRSTVTPCHTFGSLVPAVSDDHPPVLPTSFPPGADFVDLVEQESNEYDEYVLQTASVHSYAHSLGFVRQVETRRGSVKSEGTSGGLCFSYPSEKSQRFFPRNCPTSDAKRSGAPPSSSLPATLMTTVARVVSDYSNHPASVRMQISPKKLIETDFLTTSRNVTINHPIAKFGDRITTKALVNLPDICSNGACLSDDSSQGQHLKVIKDTLPTAANDMERYRGCIGNTWRVPQKTSQLPPSPLITDVHRPRSLPFRSRSWMNHLATIEPHDLGGTNGDQATHPERGRTIAVPEVADY
uniref:Uncharacterized protein n=3 Tax=Schistocephalus solidus TaxID=70667 RepID=A0A0X3P538_SCHSO